jgi:hypothetical protein
MAGKKLIMKQAGSAVAAGGLGALLGGGTLAPKYGPIPTSLLAAGIAGLATMWSRNDMLLGASLGLTGMAAAEMGSAMTSSGVRGMGDGGWARSTYEPGSDILGWDDHEELLGEDYEWADEIEI